MIKLIAMFWCNVWRNFWSWIRWHKYTKIESMPVPEVNDKNLRTTLFRRYSRYQWTADGIDELGDSFRPPQYNFNESEKAVMDSSAGPLRGDCDDYHSMVYHILKNNGYNVALITVVTKPFTKSHTMTVIRDVNESTREISYRVIDYTAVKGPFSTLQEFVDQYSLPVRYWCLQAYNYDKGKYYNVKKKEF